MGLLHTRSNGKIKPVKQHLTPDKDYKRWVIEFESFDVQLSEHPILGLYLKALEQNWEHPTKVMGGNKYIAVGDLDEAHSFMKDVLGLTFECLMPIDHDGPKGARKGEIGSYSP